MTKGWARPLGVHWGSKKRGTQRIPKLMPKRTPKVKVMIKPGTAYSSHITLVGRTYRYKYLYVKKMASKLDTILEQLLSFKEGLRLEEDQRLLRLVATVEEIVRYIDTIQEECIKVLQDRNIDEKQSTQPPFRWDSLRNDTSPFKAPYGPFAD
tara:strand:+ start:1437 stop:1895 length:459 start_codon:yes stop_codon:yes gene_type:complete